MNSYFSLFTLPQRADFTLYHLKKPFRCNSSLLCAISPVIKNLKKKTFSLPSINGSLNEVFKTIFNFGNTQIDSKSINLLIATAITLDIKRELIIQSLSDNSINPKEIYLLANDLISHDVPIDDIVPIISSNIDFYIRFFAHDANYESFTPQKLNLYAQVFSSNKISSNDYHNLFKLVCYLYKMFPETFNNSITNISTKYLNADTLVQLIDLQTYDLNQIKERVIPYLSAKNDLTLIFKSNLVTTFEYKRRGSELEGVFNFLRQLPYFADRVNISSSSECADDCGPLNLLIRDESANSMNQVFTSKDIIASVTIQLINCTFKPSAYVMKSHYHASDGMAPVSWKFEASFDDNNDFAWILLDEVKDSQSLCENDAIEVIPLNDCFQSFNKFRITQTKSKGDKEFSLARFEMFGELIEKL